MIATPADPATVAALGHILISLALLVVALALLALEFFVVSGGVIAVLSLLAAIGAISSAFAAGPAIGWSVAVATPMLALQTARWGLRRLQRSRLVTQAEITDDAGYHHHASLLGVAVGARGVLLTDAFPTGRARFPGGDLDVAVRGALVAKGGPVMVVAIEGPTVFVSAPPQESR